MSMWTMKDEGAWVIRSTRDLAPTHYNFKVESFSLLTQHSIERYESNVFESGGYKWQVALYPNGNNKFNGAGHISFYLVMAETDSLPSDFEVNVLFSLYVFDQIKDKYVKFEDGGGNLRRFHKMKTEWGYSQFMPIGTFKDSSNGFLVNDTCVFGAEVFVCEKTGRGEVLSMTDKAATFTYTWKVNKFSQLTGEYCFSKVFSAGNYKCKIKLYPNGVGTGKDKFLSLFLFFEDWASCSCNKLYVKYKLRLRDQKLTKHTDCEATRWFTDSTGGWGWQKFLEVKIFKDPTQGFLLNDTCIIEAEVTVIGSVSSFK